MQNLQEKEAIKDYQQVPVMENQPSPMKELPQDTGQTNPVGPTIKIIEMHNHLHSHQGVLG